MLVLGIDPGTATTGFGLVKVNNTNSPILVDHGLIETDKDGDPAIRLASIYQQTQTLIKDHNPEVIAMEKIFFFSNAKTVIRVSQAQGVILLAAANFSIPVCEYAPGQVKLNVAGSGKADKKIMQEAIKELFGLVPQKNKKTHFDNAVDAIAIAVCHGKIASGQQIKPRKGGNNGKRI